MQTQCPYCQQPYNVSTEHIGRQTVCRRCQASLRITAAGLHPSETQPAEGSVTPTDEAELERQAVVAQQMFAAVQPAPTSTRGSRGAPNVAPPSRNRQGAPQPMPAALADDADDAENDELGDEEFEAVDDDATFEFVPAPPAVVAAIETASPPPVKSKAAKRRSSGRGINRDGLLFWVGSSTCWIAAILVGLAGSQANQLPLAIAGGLLLSVVGPINLLWLREMHAAMTASSRENPPPNS